MYDITITWTVTGKYNVQLEMEIYKAIDNAEKELFEIAGFRKTLDWSGVFEAELFQSLIDEMLTVDGFIKIEALREIRDALTRLCAAHDDVLREGLTIDGSLRLTSGIDY